MTAPQNLGVNTWAMPRSSSRKTTLNGFHLANEVARRQIRYHSLNPAYSASGGMAIPTLAGQGFELLQCVGIANARSASASCIGGQV